MNNKTNYLVISVLMFISVSLINFFLSELDKLASVGRSFNTITQVAQIISSLDNGLVSRYKFDEVSGNTANDSAGSNHGNLISGPIWTTGKIGSGSLNFDGVDDYVKIQSPLNNYEEGSISAWVNASNWSDSLSRSVIQIRVDVQNFITLEKNVNNVLQARYYSGGSYKQVQLSTTDFVGWKMLTITWSKSSDQFKLYIDGSQVEATQTGIMSWVGTPTYNFIGTTAAGSKWSGQIDDLRIYNRALSQQEVNDLYSYTDNSSSQNNQTDPPTNTPINGSCSLVLNTCNSGVFSDVEDTTDNKLWSCNGSYGGTTASCSLPIIGTGQPINGVCSVVADTCSSGTLINTEDTNYQILWGCAGSNGGINASCSIAKPFVGSGVGYQEIEGMSLSGTYKSENGIVYGAKEGAWEAKYTVNIPSTDNYYISLVGLFNSYYDKFTLTVDGTNVTNNIYRLDPVKDKFDEKIAYWSLTGGSSYISLSAGTHEIKISNISSNVKLDKIRVVKFSDMYINDPAPSNVLTENRTFVQGAQLGFGSQDSVVWTSSKDGFNASIRANLEKASGMIRLPGLLRPGKYNVFAMVNGGKDVQIKIGNAATPKTRTINGEWTLLGDITTTADSYQAIVDIYRSGAINAIETSSITGIYITDNYNERVINGVAIDLLTRPVADTSSNTSLSGNLIPNGSFETGVDANWGFYSGKKVDLKAQWDTTVAYDGRASMRIPLDANTGWAQFATRVYHLKPNKKYTFSFWAKTTPGRTIKLGLVDTQMLNSYIPPKGSQYGRETVIKKLELTGEWKQYSVSGYALAYPTSDYQFLIQASGAFVGNGPSDFFWVDAVKLEEGDGSGDIYIPHSNIEVMIDTNVPGGIYYNNESITGRMSIYNSSTTTESAVLKYEIYDTFNTKLKEGSKNINSIGPKAYQSFSIDLSTGRNGAFRILYWLDNVNGSDKELVYSVVPQPAILGANPNSFVGIHAYSVDFQMDILKRLGIKWTRMLSPEAPFRWNMAEPSEGNFVWFDDRVRMPYNSGLNILGTLSGAPVYLNSGSTMLSRYGPVWAMDKDGLPDLVKWERYVKTIVSHYKPYVKYWEIWNEPNHQKAVFPKFDEAFYATLLKRTVAAIEEVDPEAKIVAMGGTDANFMKNIVNIIESTDNGWIKQHIDVFSTHAYPGGHSPKSFNTPTITDLGMKIWNTEAGAWDLGFYQGDVANFVAWGFSTNIAERFSKGMLTKPEDLVKNFVESVGNGMTKYFYYDSRIYSSLSSFDTHPTILEYDGTIRPKATAYAISASFIDNSKSLGELGLNKSISAYLFDKSSVPIMVIWSNDKFNRQLRTSLSSNQYTVYDIMGNPRSMPSGTIEFGRTPIYVVGKNINVADFQAKIKASSIENRSDTQSPKIAISTGPRGVIKESNFRFRWFALDETHVPQAGAPDNPESYEAVQSNSFALYYQYRLVGQSDSWSPWTTDIYHDYTAIPSGNYRFEVRAKDGDGNTSLVVSRSFAVGEGVVIETIPDANPCSGSTNNPECPVFIPIPLPEGTDPQDNIPTLPPVNQPEDVQDSDNDGVINTFDKCPGTPLSLKSFVNNYGCPRPKVANFDIKPDFNSDLTSLANLELGNKKFGMIQLKQIVQVVRDTGNYKDQLDIDSNLIFAQNKVTLNSSKLPELNRGAVITLYNISVKNPKVLKDGVDCKTCIINSYSKGTLTFTVTGFSTYEVVEGDTPTVYTPIVVNPISNNVIKNVLNPQKSTVNNLANQAINNSNTQNQAITTTKTFNSAKPLTLVDRINNYINEPTQGEVSDFNYQVPSYDQLLKDYLIYLMQRIAKLIILIPTFVTETISSK